MILSYCEIKEEALPILIEGIVINRQNNEIVNHAHVCIENAPEESETNSAGEFKILSWQRFPLALLIKHTGFETVRLTINASSRRILVFMKEK